MMVQLIDADLEAQSRMIDLDKISVCALIVDIESLKDCKDRNSNHQ